MRRALRLRQWTGRLPGCHPVTLAVWISALLILLIARTMEQPSPLVLGLHLPILVWLSLVIAGCIPDRARAIVLLVCGPITALGFAVYPF